MNTFQRNFFVVVLQELLILCALLQRTSKCSGSNSDDNDTIPFISERKKDNTKTTLKSYHSTPDCTSASVLSSESKK